MNRSMYSTRPFFLAIPLLAGLAACTDRAPSTTTVSDLINPSGEWSGQPHLAVGPTGAAVLSWIEPTGPADALEFATFSDDGWSAARTVAEGSGWFVNWADFPSVVPITEELWAAHWLVVPEHNVHAYDVVVSLSEDAGESWQAPFALHGDNTPTEHGFVSLFPWSNGIGAVWLDGRNMVVNGEPALTGLAGEPLGMSLRYARFTPDGRRESAGAIEELACDCCQTDVSVADEGPVLAYRSRTSEELRDIWVRRLSDQGWSAPVHLGPDNWHIEACPINGPAISASGRTVVVAWFTAPNDEPRVRLARSSDGGRSFSSAVDVDTVGSFGHVDVVLLDDGDAVVSWTRRHQGDQVALSVRRVSPRGELGAIHDVGVLDTARPLDFPQMVSDDGRHLIVAWTDVDGAEGLKTARVDLAR